MIPILLSLLPACAPDSTEPKDSACDHDGDGACATDCDDLDAAVHPGAAELCDGIDNNCDGAIDEGLDQTWYLDADADGYGDAASPTVACAPPEGTWTLDATDCDDADAAVNPAAVEVCDGIDNDCDGTTDAGLTTTWYDDVDGDGFGDPATATEACAAPGSTWGTTAGDCDDAEPLAWTDASEVCDGVDNDCDGEVDEGVLATFFPDADADGFGDSTLPVEACAPGAGLVADDADCNDGDSAINPAAAESCNGVDDDCDGSTDEGVTTAWYLDADADGHGDPASRTEACAAPGDGWTADGSDCNDTQALAWTGATEVCDNVDNNCDGSVDEGVLTTFYADADGDAHGDAGTTAAACVEPAGWVGVGDDCDDAEALAWTGAAEVCDFVDNNCDGRTDEGVEPAWHRDEDGDGFGASEAVSCTADMGLVGDGTDCDDSDAATRPGATESCDGTDEDCDGSVDEGAEQVWYADADGDGRGDPATTTTACPSPGAGWVAVGDDCDDGEALAWTGAVETGDGVDNDCDGLVDELRDPDWLVPNLYYGQIASADDGGWITAWDGHLGGIVHPIDFLEADGITKWVDTGDLHGSLQWLSDVDGDGHRDLFTACYTTNERWTETQSIVYAWSDVTMFDVECSDAIAEFAGDANGADAVGMWVGPDGEERIGYQAGSPGNYYIVPSSAFASRYVTAADAVASIDADLYTDVRDRQSAADADGDGIDDLLLWDPLEDDLYLFSGAEMDSYRMDVAAAFWQLDYDSDGTQAWVGAFTYADLDGDGHQDVVGFSTGTTGSDTCTAFAQVGPLAGAEVWTDVADQVPYAAPSECGDMEVLQDIDGDGLPELAVGTQPGGWDSDQPGRLDIFRGVDLAGGGMLDADADRWMWREGAGPADGLGARIIGADFDGDGTQDLTAYSYTTEDDSGTTYPGGTNVWLDITHPG